MAHVTEAAAPPTAAAHLAQIAGGLQADLSRQLRDVLQRHVEAERLRNAAELLGNQDSLQLLDAELDRLTGEEVRLLRALCLLFLQTEGSQRAGGAGAPAALGDTLMAAMLPEAGTTEASAGMYSSSVDGASSLRPPLRRVPASAGEESPVAPPGDPSGSMASEAGSAERVNGTATASRPEFRSPAAWIPRPLEDLELEREEILAQIREYNAEDPRHLSWFKSAGARFRASWEERKRYPGSQGDWWLLRSEFRQLQRDYWPNEYCIPLADIAHLTPGQWQRLSELYADLGLANRSIKWLEEQLAQPDLPPSWLAREALPLLEVSACAVNRLHRWLIRFLPSYHDVEEERLYRQLREWAHQHSFFLRLLQGEDKVKDAELDMEVARLEERFQSVSGAVERRRRQTYALDRFQVLTTDPRFGSGEKDADALCEAAFDCLEAGVPASDRRLRDLATPFAWMLEEDPRVERLYLAVTEEVDRLRAAALANADGLDDDTSLTLSPDLQEQLEEILPLTRGKRAVMIGGTARESSRRAVEERLGFAELRWPDTEPDDPFDKSAKEIEKADFVLLTRFNRRRSKEAWRICAEQKKPLVILPKGYGLNEVIYRVHDQLVSRTGL